MKHTPLNERLFEMINGEMHVFMKAIKQSGLSVGYYKNLSSEGSDKTILHPRNKKIILVKYECINQANQQKIINTYNCTPYEYIIKEPILKMITPDDKSEQFYINYTFSNGNKLPLRRIRQYTRAISWLNMLRDVIDGGNKQIKELNISVPVFYNHVKSLLAIEKENGASDNYVGNFQIPGDFPTSYQRVIDKVKEYKTNSYSLLIDKMNENKLAAKIKDEVAEAQLLALVENPLQYDDVLVCMMYNLWAKENNYKNISPGTVGVWRRKCEYSIIMGREGNAAYNEKYIRQVKGFLPSKPLLLVEHDDNNLDFLFHNTENKLVSKYVAIAVFDSRTKLLLGKSYTAGKSPEQWQVYHAYLDAMYYIRHLTGAWHLPFEIKSDKWASTSLTPFYNKIARFVPPAHGNKHRGYIEQYFGKKLWKRSQQLVSDGNWSGNNISAKYSGVNREMLSKNQQQRNLPMIGREAELQIENFFHLLRHMPDVKRTNMNAESKEELFLAEWKQLHDDDKRKISDEQFLITFGIKHEPQQRQITITNRGVEPQINNCRYSYDLPAAWMYQKLVGAKVNVVYDPFDMSRVLVTNDDDIRFVAHTAQLTPRALKDHYTGSRTYLNALLDEKKYQVQQVSNESAKRKSMVNSDYYNAEAMLQGGVMLKELKNEAEHLLLEEQFGKEHETFIDDNNDFSQFFTSPKPSPNGEGY